MMSRLKLNLLPVVCPSSYCNSVSQIKLNPCFQNLLITIILVQHVCIHSGFNVVASDCRFHVPAMPYIFVVIYCPISTITK